MGYKSFEEIRTEAVCKMQESIDGDSWRENLEFVSLLRDTVKTHPLNKHAIINRLDRKKVGKEPLVEIYLEYRYAIVNISADALLMAKYQSRQLENRFETEIKIYPRILLGNNVYDAFGFKVNAHNLDKMSSVKSILEINLDDIGLDNAVRRRHIPSRVSKKVRKYLEDNFYDYTSTLALLAVIEIEVGVFGSPLRRALGNINNRDYGLLEDNKNIEATDCLWLAFAHSCTKDDYINIYQKVLQYCELLEKFWDEQLVKCK